MYIYINNRLNRIEMLHLIYFPIHHIIFKKHSLLVWSSWLVVIRRGLGRCGFAQTCSGLCFEIVFYWVEGSTGGLNASRRLSDICSVWDPGCRDVGRWKFCYPQGTVGRSRASGFIRVGVDSRAELSVPRSHRAPWCLSAMCRASCLLPL